MKKLARECGFELAGIARAEPLSDSFARYEKWMQAGMAGEMKYLTDRRAEVRRDPRNLLQGARSLICVGKLYNQPAQETEEDAARFARYAWGRDYHQVLRESLESLVAKLAAIEPHHSKICVDTAPLLERSYARQAGLGWIGKNTCLINQPLGSWFFLGEIVTTLVIEPDTPPPDRCGTCMRCIEACPTQAIVPADEGYTLDARRCISYLNIELRGPIPEDLRTQMGANVFGCDICQEVCPWNSRAPDISDPDFLPSFDNAMPLAALAELSEEEFRETFRHTPVIRAKYHGFLRNVATAMGADGSARFREPLQQLAMHANELVAEHARWALGELDRKQLQECV